MAAASAVSIDQLAKVLNLTPRRVQQLANEGMPRAARGRYELGPCMQWYIRYLQKALESRSSETGNGITNLTTERTRQAHATAERMEMANLKARGEVVMIGAIRLQILEAIAFLGQALDAVSQRVTSDEALQEKIDDELRLARDGFAVNLESIVGRKRRMARSGAGDSEEAEADASRMG
jgi:phage terminase Nu1 subunit (DNA packaging protein)